MLDCIIRNGLLPGAVECVDLGISAGKFVEIAPHIVAQAEDEFNARGYLLTPPFVDPHFHMDSTLSLGTPRFNESGTLLEGIQIWAELKADLKAEVIKKRALRLLDWSIARGTLAVRTHVDVTDPTLLAVDVLLEVKEEMREWVDIQLVAFPQEGLLRSSQGKDLLVRAVEKGVDVVGGIPHFERTTSHGTESITWLCELAAQKGLQVDMHCDESDDPLSRHIEHLAYEAKRTGLGAKVTGSHLTSMHSMDNYYVSKLLPLIAESEIQVICNPLINIHLQGRQDNYPKRRGLTRVPELLGAGVNVAFGHDCVMDPWYPMGSHDMLEVAHMGAHCLQMLGNSQLADVFSMVTGRAAQVMQLENYGLEVGKDASFVLLQAKSVSDALRLRPARLAVFRRGQCIAETPEVKAQLHFGRNEGQVDFL